MLVVVSWKANSGSPDGEVEGLTLGEKLKLAEIDAESERERLGDTLIDILDDTLEDILLDTDEDIELDIEGETDFDTEGDRLREIEDETEREVD